MHSDYLSKLNFIYICVTVSKFDKIKKLLPEDS